MTVASSAMRTEDHAQIGDLESAALITCDGTVDRLCLPRVDSPACFAALLGTPAHGVWEIAPEQAFSPLALVQPAQAITDAAAKDAERTPVVAETAR
jgi:GH15 family glucan-1,4-alpha-glucosidase